MMPCETISDMWVDSGDSGSPPFGVTGGPAVDSRRNAVCAPGFSC